MSPLRSASHRLAVAGAILFTALGTACGDASSVLAPPRPSDTSASSSIIYETTSAAQPESSNSPAASTDTTFTALWIDASATGLLELGNKVKIQFPYGNGSICNLLTSSYGSGTWNSPCTPSPIPVAILAKSWVNAQGFVEVDFQPAMRFVPGLRKKVEVSLKAPHSQVRIDFRDSDGTLVNEALTDASLKTSVNTKTLWATRVIKHFSGYTVTAD